MGDLQIFPGSRHRPPLKRPIWILFFISLVNLFLVCAYIYPPQDNTAYYVFSSRGCKDVSVSNILVMFDYMLTLAMRENFSFYVHASKEKPVHMSRYFLHREIRSDEVVWVIISMVDTVNILYCESLGSEKTNQN
ncbi:hypothetical protein V6N11_056230 [Hibiscus sabdariffa]|uniref:Uncharacterized protein n=1 Tax=Hibiscus sabdariffa TaxID=183260 RepID=A0ABR2T391_9ROSI